MKGGLELHNNSFAIMPPMSPDLLSRYWAKPTEETRIATNFPIFTINDERYAFELQALISGVPDLESLYEYYNSEENNRNVRQILNRSKQVNHAFEIISNRAMVVNGNLYEKWQSPEARKNDEPVNVNKIAAYVPTEYFQEIPRIATPAGWGAPRLLLYIETGATDTPSEKWTYDPTVLSAKTQEILDRCLTSSSTPTTFLVALATRAIAEGLDPNVVLSFVLKRHIFEEQRNRKAYGEIIDLIRQQDDDLWREMNRLYNPEHTAGWMEMFEELRPNYIPEAKLVK